MSLSTVLCARPDHWGCGLDHWSGGCGVVRSGQASTLTYHGSEMNSVGPTGATLRAFRSLFQLTTRPDHWTKRKVRRSGNQLNIQHSLRIMEHKFDVYMVYSLLDKTRHYLSKALLPVTPVVWILWETSIS